ncbi:transposase [Patescibacteria group bacterium]
MKEEGLWVVDGKWLGRYRRESIRLKDWDYSWDGHYFVTICIKDRYRKFFGEIKKDRLALSKIGEIVQKYWQEIPRHFNHVWLDEFIVMSDHVHGIIIIDNSVGYWLENGSGVAVQRRHNRKNNYYSRISPKPNSLPTIIRSFKSICTREINKLYPNLNFKWQSKYHDSIIWNEQGLEIVREYINKNVLIHELRKIDQNNHAKIRATIKRFKTK